MSNLIIKKNDEITDELLDKVLEFDRTIFSVEGNYSFPDDYLKRMYKDSRDGIFVLMKNDIIIGYANCIFLSDEVKARYLKNKDYLSLENIGFHIGNNNIYFYTLALKEEYRDTFAVKYLMKSFAEWLKQEKEKGKIINSCISEVVTLDGLRTALTMGMLPQDIDDAGFGIYYSPDCLDSYIEKMVEIDYSQLKINCK